MEQMIKRIGILLLLCGLLLPTNKVQAEQIGVDIVAKVEEAVVPVMEEPGEDKFPKIIATALGITATGLAGGGGLRCFCNYYPIWPENRRRVGCSVECKECKT